MLTPAQLGKKIAVAPTTEPDADQPEVTAEEQLSSDVFGQESFARGTVGARALYRAWEGDPCISIDSPPGAGKTTLIVDLACRLALHMRGQVIVATPTNAAMFDIACRIGAKMKAYSEAYKKVTGKNAPPLIASLGNKATPYWVTQRADYEPSHISDRHSGPTPVGAVVVSVMTVASARMSARSADVLIVEEAYQTTFSDIATAAARIPQIIMVGDPGQIGPVIPIDTTAWDTVTYPPSKRAPEVFKTFPDVARFSLPSTYRLGKATSRAIAPLYDFTFDSQRPDTYIDGRAEIEVLDLEGVESPSERVVAETAIGRADALVGQPCVRVDGSTSTVTAADVVLIASRNEQVSLMTSLLALRPHHERFRVGTADSLQGGQWLAAISIDPLLGLSEIASAHSVEKGRLCVMTSRHQAHLTFITSTDVGLVEGVDADNILVRQNLREEAKKGEVRHVAL